MRPFAMVVRHELRDGVSKVALPERHNAMQTFLFDGAYEALGVRIGIRGALRRLDHSQPGVRELVPNRATPLRIPIAEEHPVVGEMTLDLCVPDYTTLSRRGQCLKRRLRPVVGGESIHLVPRQHGTLDRG